jgi:chitodextrinase
MDEASFNYLFELKNDIYTYSGFLQAVGKFPNFCNESNRDGHSLETECKRELSTIFAHFVRETGYHSDWEESANGIDRFR